jgi:hypothetical protein
METENDNLSTNDDNELTKFKQTDKNFHIIYRMAPFERKGLTTYKEKKIGVYTSGDVGTRIRNAETGEYYNYKVGSKYEDLFFPVRISTGECNGKYVLPTLFFTSPKHYQSYLYNDVSEETIDNWNYKRDILIKEMNEQKPGVNTLIR